MHILSTDQILAFLLQDDLLLIIHALSSVSYSCTVVVYDEFYYVVFIVIVNIAPILFICGSAEEIEYSE